MICCCSRKAADRWPRQLPRRHLNAQEGPARTRTGRPTSRRPEGPQGARERARIEHIKPPQQMTSKQYEMPEITRLEQTPFRGEAGALLAKKYDKLMKRQQGVVRQLQGLRWALDLLPKGADRKAIAAQILQAATEHARQAEHLARDIMREATPARPIRSR